MPDLILVADIGGTNTRLALARAGAVLPDTLRRHANADFDGPGALIAAYLSGQERPPLAGVCAAVAGAVTDGVAFMTNLDWQLSEEALSTACGGVRAVLMNDLQAQGHALDHLEPARLRPVIAGQGAAGAPRLVIGVGTGFNAAVVHDTGAGRIVTASEAGHATLPAFDAQAAALAAHIAATGRPPEIEEALSGRGLSALDAFLGHGGRPAPQITEAGDAGAAGTLALFARLLGAVTGDLALIHLPWGGIYLAGGVARRMAPHLIPGGFATAFRAKGRLTPLMERFPISLIDDDFAALAGCALNPTGKPPPNTQ